MALGRGERDATGWPRPGACRAGPGFRGPRAIEAGDGPTTRRGRGPQRAPTPPAERSRATGASLGNLRRRPRAGTSVPEDPPAGGPGRGDRRNTGSSSNAPAGRAGGFSRIPALVGLEIVVDLTLART